MAKAVVTPRTRIETVTLTMSEDEVQTLVSILRRVGGNRLTSRRGHALEMLKALQTEGVSSVSSSDLIGNIKFV